MNAKYYHYAAGEPPLDLVQLREELTMFRTKAAVCLQHWQHSQAQTAPVDGDEVARSGHTSVEAAPRRRLHWGPLLGLDTTPLPGPLSSPTTAFPSPVEPPSAHSSFGSYQFTSIGDHQTTVNDQPTANDQLEGNWVDRLWKRAIPGRDSAINKRRQELSLLYVGKVKVKAFHQSIMKAAAAAGIGKWDIMTGRSTWFKSEVSESRLKKFRAAVIKLLSKEPWADKDLSKCTDDAWAVFLCSAMYAARHMKQLAAKHVKAAPSAAKPIAAADAMDVDSDEEVNTLMAPSSRPAQQAAASPPPLPRATPSVPKAPQNASSASPPSLLETIKSLGKSADVAAWAQHISSRGLVHTYIKSMSAVELEGILLFEVGVDLWPTIKTFVQAIVESHKLPQKPKLLEAARMRELLARGDLLTTLGALHPALLESSVVQFCKAAEKDWTALESPPVELKERLKLSKQLEERFGVMLTHAERVIFWYRLEAYNESLRAVEQG